VTTSKKNKIDRFTISQLDKLTTQRLLQILKSVRLHAMYYDDYNEDKDNLQEQYQKYCDDIKLVLSDREHLPRKRSSNPNPKKSTLDKDMLWGLKKITRELKLPKKHPLVVKRFKEFVERYKDLHYEPSLSYKKYLE